MALVVGKPYGGSEPKSGGVPDVELGVRGGGELGEAGAGLADEDARHLRSFRDEYKARTRTGLLLHAGDRTEWLAPGILSAPWWRVL